MILAGDIGGTKTVLALLDSDDGVREPAVEKRFASKDFASLDEIVAAFLAETNARPTVATFGIAGRIAGRRVRTTNLPWHIDADALEHAFGIRRVALINDVQAIALAVPHLRDDELCVLHEGRREEKGCIGVVAPGTGLGESFLTWSGTAWQAWPTEGGHTSFAPVTLEQLELLQYLERRYGHVSFERVCSGSGVPNIYDYLVASGRYEEPDWLREQVRTAADITPVIVEAGLARTTPICIAALDLFVRVLGGVLGNMALRVMATGGLYLGGGIPPRIVERLRKRDVRDAICFKGRFREWLSVIPVSVILDPKAALHGAAWHALESD
ncbi:MAG: glucokinase [Planctomycetota bacterium]